MEHQEVDAPKSLGGSPESDLVAVSSNGLEETGDSDKASLSTAPELEVLPTPEGRVIDLREVLDQRPRFVARLIPPRRTIQILLATGVIVGVTALTAVVIRPVDAGPEALAESLVSVTVPTTAPVQPTPTTMPSPATTVATESAETDSDEAQPDEEGAAPEETTTLIEPVGEGYEVAELVLTAAGLGPLTFGSPADEVIGGLVASFGQPDFDSGEFISDGEYGTCIDQTIRTLGWGPLTVTTGGNSDAVLLGYGLDVRGSTDSHQAAELQTLSGLGIGDTVESFLTMYEGVYETSLRTRLGDGPVFEVKSGDTVLIWGPVTSADAVGTIQGIYSTPPCSQ